jgi:hypothetical protein
MYSAKLGRDNEKMFFGPMKTKFKSLVKIGGKNQAIVDCAICPVENSGVLFLRLE